MDWVSKAWESVGEAVISKSFKVCGITTDPNGSEDDLLNDRLADSLSAFETQKIDGQEALDLIFDDEGDESDEDFEGFSDSEC